MEKEEKDLRAYILTHSVCSRRRAIARVKVRASASRV